MLQRQIMFKQLQAMQQQQQFQELSDARQQHYLNQLSFLNKQTSAGLQSPLINGMPVHDASQMFIGGNMHLTQHGTLPIVQGFPNGHAISHSQNHSISSMGLPQQFDASLYGTPVVNSGNSMNAFSHIQGTSHDSANMLNMGNNSQLEMSIISNSFVNEQFNASVDNACVIDGAFVPKNFGDKNFYGQLLIQASEDGVLPANFQQPDSLQKNTSMKDSALRQEQAGWPLHSTGETLRLETSRDAASLDPLEEKILFNTEDNSWESSLGRHSNLGTVGFESTTQNVDFMGSFSSNHSGSWSALMQSAVAEASSSDTGQQEEWSGLTFQNPELSADNHHANYTGDGQQSSWVDNNLRSISSPPSKPEVLFQHSNMNYSLPTFLQSDHQVVRQKEGMHSDCSYESIQQSPKNVSKWFDCNSQQKLPVEGCQLVQTPPFQHVWQDQRPEHSRNDSTQLSISSYTMGNQPYNNLTEHELKANVWQHESGSLHMVGGSQRPADQVPHAWSNHEQGCVEQLNCVDNVADIAMNLQKVHSPDTVPWSQVPQIKNCQDHLYDNSSASQGLRLRLAPPSQQMRKPYSFPLQANSSVANASDPLYQNNQLKYQCHSAASVGNQSPFESLPLARDRFQASVATSRGSCDLFRTTVEDSTNSNMDIASGTGHEQYKQNCYQIGDNLKEVSAGPETTQGFDCRQDQVDQQNSCNASTPFSLNRSVHDQEAIAKHLLGANATTAVSMITAKHQQPFNRVEKKDSNAPNVYVRDLDTSDSYLGPHHLLQNFPMLHQVNADARQQLLFGLQSGGNILAQGDTNANSQLKSSSSGDNKRMTCSSGAGESRSGKHLSEAFIQDSRLLPSGEIDTRSHPKEQSQISVQTVPSWFKHYGTMKNGQMLPLYDLMRTISTAKQLSNGKSAEAFQVVNSIVQVDPSNASQISSILPNLDIKKATAQQLSSPFLLPSGNTKQNWAVLRPKKRKVAAFALLPWHKEVTQNSKELHRFSSYVAESEWALASNRLSERVEDEAEMMEDVLPSSQAKKRLVLTTELMQQVFRPPPAFILSTDACSNSESMIYFVARLTLGDACSLTSGFHKLPFTNDMSSKELRTSERAGQLDFPKAVENFHDRAKRLESDFLRMDKTASIVDIKVDSQELEKFSVINRFAKFHSKGHSASVNTSASSGANPSVVKTVPQRYVVAHPMPRVVPEGMNCVSL